MTSLRIARTAFRAPIAPIALIALAPLSLAAAETTSADAVPSSDIRVPSSQAPAPAAPQSYAAAFEKLFAFGLTDTRGATFVKCAGVEDPFRGSDGFAPVSLGLAWRMPSGSAAKASEKFLVSGIALFERAAATPKDTDFAPYAIFNEPCLYAGNFALPASIAFRDADLKKELERAHTRLLVWKGRRARKAADSDNGNASQQKARPDRLATHLILAAHGWRAGHTDEANRLAALALSCTDKPDAVAKAALSSIADARWGAALAEWAGTPGADSASLAKELDAIVTRYAQGWKNAPAARHLLKQLRSAKAPAAPTLEKHTFSPDQLKFAADLLTLRDLPADADWLAPAKPDEKASPVIKFLREQGVEALPLLAVLAEDSAATACIDIKPPSRNSGYSWSSSDDESRRSDADAFRQWKSRPLTRGELASRLLKMPKGYSFDISEEQSLSDSILVAYHVIKREGRVGLLLEKLSFARDWNRRELWENLMNAGLASDAEAARLEAGLMECADKADILREHFTAYLTKRGAKSADFFAKFSAAARADIEAIEEAEFAKEPQRRMERTRRHDQNTPTTKAGVLAEFDRAIARLRPLVEAKN